LNKFGDIGEFNDEGKLETDFKLNELERCRLVDTGVEKIGVS